MNNKFRLRRSESSLVVATCLATLAMPTMAQTNTTSTNAATASQNNYEALAEIVVTAQFRKQNLQQTPLAITAITGDLLEARSQTSVIDIANHAPNVSLRPGFAQFGSAIAVAIRGLGQADFDPSFEPGVGMYVDDVYFPTLTGANFALLDIDRVEILRGPQGTLSGRNSLGGSIKLYTKKPGDDAGGRVSATYGSRDRIDFSGAWGFNVTDGIDVRLAGVSKRQQGYVKRMSFACVNPPGSALNPPLAQGGIPVDARTDDHCVVGHDGGIGYTGLRGQLRVRPNSHLDINLIVDVTNEDHTPSGTVLLAAQTPPGTPRQLPGAPQIQPPGVNVPYDNRFVCGRFCNYATYSNPANPTFQLSPVSVEPRVKYDGWGTSAQVDWTITDAFNVTSITAYREYDTSFGVDDDQSPLNLGLGSGLLEFKFASQELRLNGSLANGAVDFTVGGFYSNQRTFYTTTQDLRWAMFPFSAPRNRTPATSKAAFTHVAWKATDALTLTGGVRYTKESKTQTFYRRTTDGSAVLPLYVPIQDLVGRYSGSHTDYRANVSYQFSKNLMAYGQFSTGFKGGGINSRPFVPAQIQPFGPETMDAWEVGLKSDLIDRKLRLNFAAFLNKYKDIQQTLRRCPQYGFPACILTANVGDADLTGFEVELTAVPIEALTVDASLSYLNFKYTRVDPATNITKGMTTPFFPKSQASLGIQYEHSLGNAGSLTTRLDGSYRSGVFTRAVNTERGRINAYTLVDGRLTWRNKDRDVETSVEVTNIFNKYYFQNILEDYDSFGAISAIPGHPREWGVTVTKKF